MGRDHAWWLLVLLCVGVRVVNIQRPLLGNFATKNVTYAMIARNWATGRASIWRPTTDHMAGSDRGWHLTELPVSAYLAGAGWRWLGGSLDVWGRGLSVACSALSLVLLFGLVQRWHSRAAAWGAGAMFALAPVSIIFGQSFMLEAPLVCLCLATTWFLEAWLARRGWWCLPLAGVMLMLATFTKIYVLVLAVPWLFRAWTGLRTHDGPRAWPRLASFVAIGGLAISGPLYWYADAFALSATNDARAERVFFSIRRSATENLAANPVLRSADFYRQMLDDLAGIVLTPVGFGLALVGLVDRASRRHLPWLASLGLLVLVLPLKFYKLNYYWLVVLPPLCVLVGIGWQKVQERLQPSRWCLAGLLVVSGVFSMRHAWQPAFVTPGEDRSVVTAAARLQDFVASDERIVTMHGSTTDLLYYCNRAGWAVSARDRRLETKLANARQQGARWLLATNLRELEIGSKAWRVLKDCPVIREGDDFRLYSLSTDPLSHARSPAHSRQHPLSAIRRASPQVR